MRKDRFTDEALRAAKALAELKYSEDPAEQMAFAETYDFARCQRADGSFYGTSGSCRLGKEAGSKETTPTEKLKQGAASNPAVMRREKDKATAAKKTQDMYARAAQRRAGDEKTAAIRELKSKDAELRSAAKDKIADQKTRKAELDRIERAFKAQEKAVKAEPTKENKERLKRVRTALIQQDRFYQRGERELEKIGNARLQLSKKIERMQMSPEQRAEARRIGKIIKERG